MYLRDFSFQKPVKGRKTTTSAARLRGEVGQVEKDYQTAGVWTPKNNLGSYQISFQCGAIAPWVRGNA